jgi:hypothetical protein
MDYWRKGKVKGTKKENEERKDKCVNLIAQTFERMQLSWPKYTDVFICTGINNCFYCNEPVTEMPAP